MHRLMGELIARISHELLYHPQYGLETFLSARIRHGYVRGLLVTFLQELDLIAIYDQELSWMITAVKEGEEVLTEIHVREDDALGQDCTGHRWNR